MSHIVKLSLSSWGRGAQTVRFPSKLNSKMLILTCWPAPEMTPVARNCGVWAVCWAQEVPHQKQKLRFWGPQIPCAEIWKFLTPVTTGTPCRKSRVVFKLPLPENTFWRRVWCHPWGDFLKLCLCDTLLSFPTCFPKRLSLGSYNQYRIRCLGDSARRRQFLRKRNREWYAIYRTALFQTTWLGMPTIQYSAGSPPLYLIGSSLIPPES